jgi:tripartite-type tricarboxylate transporter receptor subunit TctC
MIARSHCGLLVGIEKMRALRFTLTFILGLAGVFSAAAQTYPSRPITMIVPFAAGGPTDTIALIIADGMRKFLGQAVVTENVTGAAGTVAIGRLVQAPPDGYTVGIGHWSTNVLNGAIYALPYDLLSGLTPIALIVSNPQVIIAKKAMPANDLSEMIAWLKVNPDKALEGTAGTGSPSHIAGVYFQNRTGTRFQFIPYRGGAPAIQALLAGQMDLGFEQAANVLAHIRDGEIKAFAVTGRDRLAAAPQIPTVDEAGLPGFHISVWHGLWAPAATPREIINKLNSALVNALSDVTVRQRLADLAQDIPPAKQQTPEALAAFQKAEIEKWWPIIKAANIRVE